LVAAAAHLVQACAKNLRVTIAQRPVAPVQLFVALVQAHPGRLR
jgi:hypothetical protein